MRNLNGYEIAGRTLRVDNACTEKSRLEMQSLMQVCHILNQIKSVNINETFTLTQEKSSESPYGDVVDPLQAPEAISKAVCSLPPEQMFELMQQMKLCIHNNPNESRQMLMQNPQLAYALLQALVVMRVVDPSAAVAMLQKGGVQGGDIGHGLAMPGALGAPPAGGQMYPMPKQSFPVANETWSQSAPSVPRSGLLGDRPFAGEI